MAENFMKRFVKRGWNAFTNKDPTAHFKYVGPSSSYRPDRVRYTRGNEKSIVSALYTRIALDVAALDFCHAELDKDGRFLKEVDSGLNNCLKLEANIDQTAFNLKLDIVQSMLDEGAVALIPVDTDKDIEDTESYDILSMRTGRIREWYPYHVKVEVYNERKGEKEDIIMPKSEICIFENPLYSVINERNSIAQRLIRKLNLLDSIDEQSGSGKLDLIIQLPYTVKSPERKRQADNRRKDIEAQLTGSKYGIAYTDATERITQLNRPVENNLMKQIEYLTSMLYSQIGFHQSILDGTADEKTMQNYYSRIVKLFARVIADEMKRKFLTKTARTQFKSIEFFRDPFDNVAPEQMAEMADKYTRNEILSKNEVRQKGLGMKPSNDPKADQLINSNISQPDSRTQAQGQKGTTGDDAVKGEVERLLSKNEAKE